MEELDDLESGTDVDIWDHKIAKDMRDLKEICAEVVSENQIIAPTVRICDSDGQTVKNFSDGLPAKVIPFPDRFCSFRRPKTTLFVLPVLANAGNAGLPFFGGGLDSRIRGNDEHLFRMGITFDLPKNATWFELEVAGKGVFDSRSRESGRASGMDHAAGYQFRPLAAGIAEIWL